MKVSVESANCLVERLSVGEKVMQNICTGEVHSFSWNAYEWAGFCLGSFLIIAIIAFTAFMVKLAIFD